MARGGWFRCLSCMAFSLNMIILIISILIFSFGTYIYVHPENYSTYVYDRHHAYGLLLFKEPRLPGTIFIIVGAILFFISFFGLVGIVTESQWMLWVFVLVSLIVFVLEVMAFIIGLIMRRQIRKHFESAMTESLHKYYESKSYQKAWNTVQSAFKCCGVFGPNDWVKKNLTVPFSCCKDMDYCCTNCEPVYKVGCFPLYNIFNSNLSPVSIFYTIAIFIYLFLQYSVITLFSLLAGGYILEKRDEIIRSSITYAKYPGLDMSATKIHQTVYSGEHLLDRIPKLTKETSNPISLQEISRPVIEAPSKTEVSKTEVKKA